tara:strand:+ start:11248 stop:11835 length:588 start_codon:yes stop_codon:yes gene_type:complete
MKKELSEKEKALLEAKERTVDEKMMAKARNSPIDEVIVLDTKWKSDIQEIFTLFRNVENLEDSFINPSRDAEDFLSIIWHKSQTSFDLPREIQVIVDSNDKLFMNVGTPSFVSFSNQESSLKGMKLPIKCWIHTHPFGEAFFSHTDWTTLDTWKPMMESAIVLGNNQYWAFDLKTSVVKIVQFGVLQSPLNKEEE